MDQKTLDDLKAAFAGESQANRKYLAFSHKASDEGFKGVALLFRAIAEAETVHAINHFKLFGVGDTTENLKAAITGENYEVTTMYPDFLADAEKAGEKGAVRSLKIALESEKIHEAMYIDALQAVMDGEDVNVSQVAICSVCGHTAIGDAPDECPICKSKKAAYGLFTLDDI